MKEQIADTLEKAAGAASDTTAISEKLMALQNMGERLSSVTDNPAIAKLIDFGVSFGLKIIAVVIVYFAGRFILRYLKRILDALMSRKQVDVSLISFVITSIDIVFNFFLIIIIIGILGIETSSFIALLGAAGVAIGMALSGTLQNFAGGVILLLVKPFKTGDFIEAQGFIGTVKEIQIFNTVIRTPDNKVITIPNGNLATSTSINYSREENRRLEWDFDIAYGDSYDNAKTVITELLDADSRILHDPAYFIALGSLDASSVKVKVRVWVKNADYWDVYFDMNEKRYKTFGTRGLNIPFNQLDVHIHNQ